MKMRHFFCAAALLMVAGCTLTADDKVTHSLFGGKHTHIHLDESIPRVPLQPAPMPLAAPYGTVTREEMDLRIAAEVEKFRALLEKQGYELATTQAKVAANNDSSSTLVSLLKDRINLGDGKLFGAIDVPGGNIVELLSHVKDMKTEISTVKEDLREDTPAWVTYLVVALGFISTTMGGAASVVALMIRSTLIARYRREDNIEESRKAAAAALGEKE